MPKKDQLIIVERIAFVLYLLLLLYVYKVSH